MPLKERQGGEKREKNKQGIREDIRFQCTLVVFESGGPTTTILVFQYFRTKEELARKAASEMEKRISLTIAHIDKFAH